MVSRRGELNMQSIRPLESVLLDINNPGAVHIISLQNSFSIKRDSGVRIKSFKDNFNYLLIKNRWVDLEISLVLPIADLNPC